MYQPDINAKIKNIGLDYINILRGSARQKLLKRYMWTEDSYNIKTINDIMYNQKTLVVSNFKEFLLYDDYTEFMKR